MKWIISGVLILKEHLFAMAEWLKQLKIKSSVAYYRLRLQDIELLSLLKFLSCFQMFIICAQKWILLLKTRNVPSFGRTNPSTREGFTGLNNKIMTSNYKSNPSARQHRSGRHRRAKQPCTALPKKEKQLGLLLLICRPARKRTRKGKIMNRNFSHNLAWPLPAIITINKGLYSSRKCRTRSSDRIPWRA